MYIYLPIAEQPINAFIVLGIGWLVGIIMGMVGIGGGFLLTPLMIFFGIPSPVAVASVANQLVAPSVSGVLSHWKSGNVDFKMGTILLVGGVIGSSIGVLIFNILKKYDFKIPNFHYFLIGFLIPVSYTHLRAHETV